MRVRSKDRAVLFEESNTPGEASGLGGGDARVEPPPPLADGRGSTDESDTTDLLCSLRTARRRFALGVRVAASPFSRVRMDLGDL
jgi:hypothetical protein